ncbi:hypothetical protein [Cohnella luojiensis]|uniref:hypothetical protein n=1 Tax=Cohnella luojiensis TaxID=652876 RepID=UPI001431C624|nr:hypothetical protein [Cohnella luojiensis]
MNLLIEPMNQAVVQYSTDGSLFLFQTYAAHAESDELSNGIEKHNKKIRLFYPFTPNF